MRENTKRKVVVGMVGLFSLGLIAGCAPARKQVKTEQIMKQDFKDQVKQEIENDKIHEKR